MKSAGTAVKPGEIKDSFRSAALLLIARGVFIEGVIWAMLISAPLFADAPEDPGFETWGGSTWVAGGKQNGSSCTATDVARIRLTFMWERNGFMLISDRPS